MPAKKNPVKNLKPKRLQSVFSEYKTPRLNNAPSKALTKNTLDGENRSVMVNNANKNVPVINPN